MKTQYDVETAIDKLRTWREDSIRNPEAIRELLPMLDKIEKNVSTEEKWTLIEQFCMAAIDLHDEKMIKLFLGRLNKQFTDSDRVKLLNIMANHERVGDYETAIQEYNEMIKEDPTNTGPRKRKISILIAQHNNAGAIKELCDYLRRFMNDVDAWKELCELYLLEQDYQRAIFCMEEVLLSDPSSYANHIRLAEMHYTCGGYESLELAKSYYTQALKLEAKNMRALLGLLLTLPQLLKGNRLTPSKRKEYEKFLSNIKSTISEIYKKDGHVDASKYIEKSIE